MFCAKLILCNTTRNILCVLLQEIFHLNTAGNICQMRCCLLFVTFVVFVVFVVLFWSDGQVCVLAQTRAGPPATAWYGEPVRSSGTGSVQSWRSRGASVSLPASLAFLTRGALLAWVSLLPTVSLQAGDAVQSSQAVLPRLALLSQLPGLSLQQL